MISFREAAEKCLQVTDPVDGTALGGERPRHWILYRCKELSVTSQEILNYAQMLWTKSAAAQTLRR